MSQIFMQRDRHTPITLTKDKAFIAVIEGLSDMEMCSVLWVLSTFSRDFCDLLDPSQWIPSGICGVRMDTVLLV